MGRPKGSVNRKKPNGASHEPVAEVTPQEQTEVETGEGVASDVSQEASTPEQEVVPATPRTFDDVAHDMAKVQGQLDELEGEKAVVMKDYGKRIGVLESKVSQLAAEYRALERREEFDYTEGVCRVYCGHTGALLETRPIADSERQMTLDDLPKPKAPPFELAVGVKCFWSGSKLTGTITAVDEDGIHVDYGEGEDPAVLGADDFVEAVPVQD
jgi:hypothetical protein